MCMKKNGSKKLHELDMATGMEVAFHMAKIQSGFTEAIFAMAKDYGLDDIELLRMAATVVLGSAESPEFAEKVAPSIREELEKEDEE